VTPLATAQAGLLALWVTFTAVALAGIVAVIVWAVRSGQFADQDRARYLPLESGIPDGCATVGSSDRASLDKTPRTAGQASRGTGRGAAAAKEEADDASP
jgi:nitrogen fixation-related uncharacterized protein